MMLVLSPLVVAANPPARSIPAFRKISSSIPMPRIVLPLKPSLRRRNASGSRSMIVTECPSDSSIEASIAPTRPHPRITTCIACGSLLSRARHRSSDARFGEPVDDDFTRRVPEQRFRNALRRPFDKPDLRRDAQHDQVDVVIPGRPSDPLSRLPRADHLRRRPEVVRGSNLAGPLERAAPPLFHLRQCHAEAEGAGHLDDIPKENFRLLLLA